MEKLFYGVGLFGITQALVLVATLGSASAPSAGFGLAISAVLYSATAHKVCS
jgi:hypothetical protein